MSDIHHHHKNNVSATPLLLATILNFLITVIEIIGGVLSNSLSLLSDAFHNLGDTIASLLAFMANLISKRKPSISKTFGFKRIEILAALFNATVMTFICLYLLYESYKRFIHPKAVFGKTVMIIASIGFVLNLLAAILLNNGRNKNINIKAAYLHLLADSLSSVVVIIGGFLMFYFKIYWIDPLFTALISLYILKETFSILYQSYLILMQATPANINVDELKKTIENSITDIDNIHHIHIWNLNDYDVYFECHVDLKKDIKISETDLISVKLKTLLHELYSIQHFTIQFEYDSCDSKSILH